MIKLCVGCLAITALGLGGACSSSSASGVGGSGSSSGGVGTCTTSSAATCAAADTGSMVSHQTCVFTCCAQTYCREGSATYYEAIAACVCTASLCKSACSGSGDYCNSPPDVASTACNTCLNMYLGAGLECDPSTGAIAAACSADSQCTAYMSCMAGCP